MLKYITKYTPKIPLAGASINILKNIWDKYGNWKQSDHKWRIIFTATFSLFITSFFTKLERLLYRKKIANTDIQKDPIFIIGHWRSGTTFLHYLMSKDDQFGYLSCQQSFCPDIMFLLKPIVKFFTTFLIPGKRPMDDMEISTNAPQEEEFALTNTNNCGAYLWWYFPSKMRYYFDKYVLLKKKEDQVVFENTLYSLVKKMTLLFKGKQLLLKNPANTARIASILKIFPNAKFIYLHRDPYEVYHSTVKLHRKLIDVMGMEAISTLDISRNVIDFYPELIEKYNNEKTIIPKGQLMEVSYEKMIEDPMLIIKNIYQTLGVQFSFEVETNMRMYLKTQEQYTKDEYDENPFLKRNLYESWNKVLEKEKEKVEIKTAIT